METWTLFTTHQPIGKAWMMIHVISFFAPHTEYICHTCLLLLLQLFFLAFMMSVSLTLFTPFPQPDLISHSAASRKTYLFSFLPYFVTSAWNVHSTLLTNLDTSCCVQLPLSMHHQLSWFLLFNTILYTCIYNCFRICKILEGLILWIPHLIQGLHIIQTK